MGKIAFVFAGQGAQTPGMGKDVCEAVPSAAEVFAKADAVREGTSRQCFEADAAELMETKNTQPCVFTVDLAMAAALEAEGIHADMTAGYSLGELAALVYAGAMTMEEGTRLVAERGRLMQIASEAHETGMAAVLKLSDEQVEEICAKYPDLYPVNFNSDGQVSVAGDKEQLRQMRDDVKAARGIAKILDVSGAFHSPYMNEAAEEFGSVLAEASFTEPQIPVYSNRTAESYEGQDIRTLLREQIINPVYWKKLVRNMIEEGVDTFIELGPGKALTSMITRIDKNVKMYRVSDMETLQQTLEGVKNNA
jgi:[acyl-carrier-protein] S-malonyltransferase